MTNITENLAKIRDLLAEAAASAGREPDSVRLLAVSKKHALEKVLEAAAAGHRDFGENQVQEGLDKLERTTHENLVWHFIGHLQSNKTRAVAEHFDWVHSIDRLRLAERLSRQRPEGLPALNLCLQVNIDSESSKSGIAPEAAADLAAAVHELPNLRLRGLMCLPEIRDDFEAQRAPFARLRELQVGIVAGGIPLDTLSMGMSNDYRAAIVEGATIVRIGTAIFGSRT